jgi:hypothetical protein
LELAFQFLVHIPLPLAREQGEIPLLVSHLCQSTWEGENYSAARPNRGELKMMRAQEVRRFS